MTTWHFVVATIVTVGALVATVWALSKRSMVAVPLKMVASTGFLTIALMGGALETRYGQIVLGALILCWIGDLLLAFEGDGVFLAGLVAFLSAHLGLMIAFCAYGQAWTWAIAAVVALTPVGVAIFRWLRPHVPKRMLGPVIAYMLVISVMVLLAMGAQGRGGPFVAALGAIAFYVSDLFVARQKFVKAEFLNSLVGLPIYYTAVTLLAFSVLAA